MITKADLKGYISDLFLDFLYYSRKEDDKFTVEDGNNLPSIVTKEELLRMFKYEIDRIYSNS